MPTLKEVIHLAVAKALVEANGNHTDAGKALGVSRYTISRYLKQMGARWDNDVKGLVVREKKEFHPDEGEHGA